MKRIEKSAAFSLQRANAEADIDLINRYSVKQLTPQDVFCFTVALCNNDVDRDTEMFSDAALDALAPMFVGKTGIRNHDWRTENQVARIYRTSVETRQKKTATGKPLRELMASAYMLRDERTQPTIEAVEGGIIREVSVGARAAKCACSVCGKTQRFDWNVGRYKCEDGHLRGDRYDGALCVGVLDDPKEAYEFSFVPVPSQREAGVRKEAADVTDAFETLLAVDLSEYEDWTAKLYAHCQAARESGAEREARQRILAENAEVAKRYRKG